MTVTLSPETWDSFKNAVTG